MSEPTLAAPASPRDLFRVFNRMALQGFGGVLPVAQRELVERERWMTREQFLQTLSIGQVLPGPNIINMSIMIGDRFFGARGIVAAMGGLLTLPLVIVLALAALYGQFAEVPVVAGALRGMGAVAAGLVIATALKLGPTLAKSPLGRPAALAFAAATLLTVGALRWPLVWVVLGLGSVSMALAWWRLAR
jgi:chromate transporter